MILSDTEQNAYKVQLSDDITDLENGFVVEYNGTKFSTGGALSLGKWAELSESDTAMTITLQITKKYTCMSRSKMARQ